MLFSIIIIIASFIIAATFNGAGIDAVFGIRLIVTHPGRFHADETAGVGMIKFFSPFVKVVRRVPTKADLADPTVLVLDIGKDENYELNNMDHHQGLLNPAACVMVLSILPLTDLEKWTIYFLIYNPISMSDIGITKSSSNDYNGVIRAFNTLNGGFDKAVELGTMAFEGYLNTARSIIKTKDVWQSGEIIFTNGVAIYEGDVFLQSWELFAEMDGIKFLVKKAGVRNPGEWQVLSRDSKQFPIGKAEGQTFLHKNAFIATYKTKEAAIAHMLG